MTETSTTRSAGQPLRVLHLEDDADDAALISKLLKKSVDCEVKLARTRPEFEAALAVGHFEVILSDYSLPGFSGIEALRMSRTRQPEAAFIFVSATIGEDRAVEALHAGAVDYVVKDRLTRLISAVQRAVRDARDRAARLRIEGELRHHDALFRQLSESVDDAIAVLDLEARLVFGNRSHGELYGVLRESVGRDAFAQVHPDDRARMQLEFQQTVLGGKGRCIACRCVQSDGRVRYVESQRSVIRDQAGKVTHVVVVSRDITEREQAAKRIREQAALLDQAPDAIFASDLDQRISYWNKGAERLYGWTANEVLGRRLSELLEPNPEPPDKESAGNAGGWTDWAGELTHCTKDGREIVVASRQALLRDATGEPTAILAINTDISERKQLEAQFLRAQRLENIGSLAGGIAHDLNNILAPMLLVADMLSGSYTTEEDRQMLAIVKESARRGSELVNQILRFTRGIKGEPVPIHLRQVVNDLTSLAKNTFPRMIQIESWVDAELRMVMGDATQIHQVLLNLCVNARDAMSEGGKLVIEASNVMLDNKAFAGHGPPVSGAYVLLRVSDTGAGIPADLLQKIFQPFFTTKTTERGTGLGLSTVAKIVQSHQGFVELSSELGRGSTFKVYLPAAGPELAPAANDTPGKTPVGCGEHILLVDDERAVLEMTCAMLTANEYRVTAARNGAEALELFRERADSIDVIVTDLIMPVMDGAALIREARRLKPEVRVVCITGMWSEARPPEPSHGDVRACLRKPYTAGELLCILRDVLG